MKAPEPSSVDRARLRSLAVALDEARRKVRYVGYRQGERDCEVLAEKLRAEFTQDDLAGYHFRAVPRGGLIVLGMLSYVLDLKAEQLLPPRAPDVPWVLVDDCALTGSRIAQAIGRLGGEQSIVVAHLYSHPDLRSAVVAQEPRVKACLAARDLSDHPLPGAEHWRARWRERLEGDRYWIGHPEWLSFAWSEPDRPFWNPVTETVEDGWRLTPPHRCLKNRYRLGASGTETAWRLADDVAYGQFDGILWLWEPRSEELFSLGGVALDMFRHLLRSGIDEGAIAALVASWRVDEDTARQDFQAFAESLRDREILVPPRDMIEISP